MVRHFLFGGIVLAAAAAGYGVSEFKSSPPIAVESLVVMPAPAVPTGDSYAPDQAAIVASKASLSRILEPAQGEGYLAVCETPLGECTVGPLPINSGCFCGSTPGRITR